MNYQVILTIFVIMYGIGNLSFRVNDQVCTNISTGAPQCCYNFEKINGVCTACKVGTVAQPGSRCQPCEKNMYGFKCVETCNCDMFHRCDAALGCIMMTISSPINRASTGENRDITFAENNSTVVISSSSTKPILEDIVLSKSGTSTLEWLIYTLCITGFVILTAMSHVVRSYRKRQSSTLKSEHVAVNLEAIEPIVSIYDEIDDNIFSSDTIGTNMTSHVPSIKNSFVVEERHTTATHTEHDDTDYLDALFEMDEDERQYSKGEITTAESISTSSSNSSIVGQSNILNLNPYQLLQHFSQEEAHEYEVTVSVHQSIERSTGSKEDVYFQKCAHEFKSLQKGRDLKSSIDENLQSPVNKIAEDATLQTATLSSNTNFILSEFTNNNVQSARTNEIYEASKMQEEESFDQLDEEIMKSPDHATSIGIVDCVLGSMSECTNDHLNFQSSDTSTIHEYSDAKSCN